MPPRAVEREAPEENPRRVSRRQHHQGRAVEGGGHLSPDVGTEARKRTPHETNPRVASPRQQYSQ